jgi:hypothetical protein
MLYIALTQAVVIALLIGLFIVRERDHDRALQRDREAATLERAELLNRIQRPEFIPRSPGEVPAPQPPSYDEFERVGTITLGEPEDEQ